MIEASEVSRAITDLQPGDKFFHQGELVQFERRNMQWWHVSVMSRGNRQATISYPPETKPHEIYVDLV